MVAPCKPPRSPSPNAPPAHPRRPPRPPSYGSLSATQHATATATVVAPLLPTPPAPAFSPQPAKPRPVGPLARVPSNPSFVPSFVIDLDAVATRVSERVGAVHTAQDLLNSLEPPSAPPPTTTTTTSATTSTTTPRPESHHHHHHHHPFSYPPERVLRSSDDLWESKYPYTPPTAAAAHPPHLTPPYQTPLEVVVAREDASMFSDEALVLKIRSHDHHPVPDHQRPSFHHHQNPHSIPTLHRPHPHTTEHPDHSGFAINIPVTKDTHHHHHNSDPFDDDGPSSWDRDSAFDAYDRYYPDEEDPLLFPDDTGLNMSYKSSSIPTGGQAFVQRYGARNIAAEQEVLFAVNADKLGNGTTGLFLPVMDSKDDLKQLMFIHPPENNNTNPTLPDEEDPLLDTHQDDPYHHHQPTATAATSTATTAEGAREYVESFTNIIPSIVDIESKLEVHGTAKNATVAINVTKQVSWVGYIVLAIALASVASQGTAVKWLPSVDGLVAATWLMQTQTLLMLPFAIFQCCTLNADEQAQIQKTDTWRLIILASLAQVCWVSGFFVAIDHTSLFHAWSLNNVHALLIVVFAVTRKTCLREKSVRISGGEVTGARIALIGVVVMQLPALFQGDNEIIAGDAVAILGSLGAIAFLNLCKTLRNRVPLFLMMTPITALNAACLSVGSMVINGTDFSVTDQGALGWMRSDRLALALYLGGVVGFLGTVCCIAALKFLPSVVVGSVQTMMPVAGTLVAVIAGVDTLPDFWSTVGGLVLLYGVLIIADATRQTEDVVVVNELISEVGAVNAVK